MLDTDAEQPLFWICRELTLTITPAGVDRFLIELHDGDTDNGYAETVKRDRWMDGEVRTEIADRISRIFPKVSHGITGMPTPVEEEELREEIELALNAAVHNRSQFKRKMRDWELLISPSGTKQVVLATIDGEYTWIVELSPPENSPIDESQFFALTGDQLYSGDPDAFRKAYLKAFAVAPEPYMETDLDTSRWNMLVREWVSHAEHLGDEIENIDSLPDVDEIHEVSLETS